MSADYRDVVGEVDLYYSEVEDLIEEMLNDSCGLVDLVGYGWPAGTLLRRADPIAFTEEVLSFISGQLDAGEWVELV